VRIDLNADIGEGFALDKELMELVTSVNVACGSHAGSPELSIVTAEEARRRGLRVAAHPGYPDREHFGRMSLAADPATWLLKQLRLFPHSAVKPHGAFYDDLLSGCWPNVQFEVPVIGVAGRSSRTLREGFAERGYDGKGERLPRSHKDALIHDPDQAARQAVRLARSGEFETLCIHGDSPNAVAIARAVRDALRAEGITVAPWS